MPDAFPQSGRWDSRNGTSIRRIYSVSHIDYPCHESWQMMYASSDLNLLHLAWVIEADTTALPLDPIKNTSSNIHLASYTLDGTVLTAT
jgi:hypothetical protein